MELTVGGRQRRTGQAAASPLRAEKKTAGTKGGTAPLRPRSDKADWSQAALSFLQEVNRQDAEKQRKLLEARQKGNGELDALTKALKTMDNCRKIASRIMRGDKVPPQDERYLMENDPDGYKLAMACRTPKEKPKEWESVLEDEDREGGDCSGSGGTVEASDGGGAAPEA